MLWLAYCDLQNNENVSARVLLESVPEMEQKSDNFPIYCLLQGRLSIVEENDRTWAISAWNTVIDGSVVWS